MKYSIGTGPQYPKEPFDELVRNTLYQVVKATNKLGYSSHVGDYCILPSVGTDLFLIDSETASTHILYAGEYNDFDGWEFQPLNPGTTFTLVQD